MRSLVIRLLGLALLSGGMWVAYTQAPQPTKLDVVKFTDNLYAIHNDYVPGNTTVLITNEGVVLVDDKFPQDGDNIIAEVKKLTTQPIKYVINTHHHGDHSGSNAKMQQIGAQVISTEEARQNMVDGNQPGLSNITFKDHGHVYLGGQNVEFYHWGRAHTNGDAVVLFPQQRVLAAGDMFAFGDLTPELVDYAGGGSAKEWPLTLENALKLDFDRVVPGHGDITNKSEMAKFRQRTIDLRNQVHQMMLQKKSRAEIEQKLRKDFHFADLHIERSLDGLMIELQ